MIISRQLTDSASASTASDIQLGSCVTEIGQGAFSGYTNITDVEFPDSLTTIGAGAFSGSSMTSVDIPNSVQTIGSNAFNDCSNLTNITVNAVTPPTLGEDAFNGSTCAIVVPSESYNSYIQSSWSVYKNRITYEGMALKLNFINGSTSSFLICDGNTITKDDVDSIYFSDITATTIGSCVTEIGQGAFSGKTLGNVTFEEGTTTIGNEAFYNINTNLAYSTITLPKSLTTIGSQVFHNNSADTRIEINAYGDSGLKLDKSSFYPSTAGTFKLNLYNMSIPANAFEFKWDDYGFREVGVFGMSSIGASAFASDINSSLSLTSVTIGDGVRVIEDKAFQNNNEMTNLALGNSLLDIGDSAFARCSGLTSVVIPDSVINIGAYAFNSCTGLTSINIPSGLTSIKDYTFQYCRSLTSITIPNSVTSIGDYAFDRCSGLTSVTIGNNVRSIGNRSFYRSFYSTQYGKELIVNMSNSVTNIGDDAFYPDYGTTYFDKLSSSIIDVGKRALYKCRFENFALPRTIKTIGNSAFSSCSGITNVTIPSDITSLGAAVFSASDIKSATFENGILAIPNSFFSGCKSFTSVTIPNSVTTIGESAFASCYSLTSVNIPNSVTTIGESAFVFSSGLTSCTIGSGVTNIGRNAFGYCSGLTSVTVNATTPPTLGGDIFGEKTPISKGTGVIFVPCEYVDVYKTASGWSDYASCILGLDPCAFIGKIKAKDENNNVIIVESCSSTSIENRKYRNNLLMKEVEIGSCTTNIGSYAFSGCSNLSSIDFILPSSISSISNYAFANCTSLTSVTIPDSVTSIGGYAFRDCTSLTSVAIPNSVTSFNTAIFLNCNKLTSITIPDSVTSISNYVFRYCTSLTSVTIPSGVTSIGDYAFSDCSGLTSITIPDSVTSISNYAFSNCSSLIAASLSNGLTSISSSLFRGCLRLLSITIPSGVTSIGDYAFSGCRSFTNITVNAITPPTLGEDVFADTNDCIIYVPATSVDAYKEAVAEGWSTYASRIQAIP